MPAKNSEKSIGDDLLYGIRAIAAELKTTERQAYYLHECKQLPTFKLGGKICARRSQLDAELRAQPSR